MKHLEGCAAAAALQLGREQERGEEVRCRHVHEPEHLRRHKTAERQWLGYAPSAVSFPFSPFVLYVLKLKSAARL